MLIEPNAQARAERVSCVVCVVGAGPAGISLALSLARRGVRTVLIESGGLRPNRRIQSLADAAELDARRHAPMDIATARVWGGASTIWGGRCLPLDPVDFDGAHESRGHWPISHSELAKYYPEACRFALCGANAFTVQEVFGSSAKALAPGLVDGEVVCSYLERWSLPTNFGEIYENEVRRSRHVDAFLGLTCVSLQFDGARDRVVHMVARSLDGRQLTVEARYFVLAAGGLETTRILLNNDSVHPRGIGNQGDALGRYYMGHVSGKIAEVQFTTPPSQTIYGFERDTDGIFCRRRLAVSPTVQRDRSLCNCVVWLDNPPLWNARHRNGILSLAYLALRTPGLSRRLAPDAIRRAVTENFARSGVAAHLRNVARDLPRTIGFVVPFVRNRYFAYRKLPGFFVKIPSNRYALHYHGEHLPNRLSRVWLDTKRDELGVRRLNIDLRYADDDIESVHRTHEIIDSHLRKLNVGYVEYQYPDPSQAIRDQAKDGIHQIGTTRMSARPEDGVVDGDCRVHGIGNLFVASSSVFPTSGQANPTLSIVALALRIADHLHRVLTPS